MSGNHTYSGLMWSAKLLALLLGLGSPTLDESSCLANGEIPQDNNHKIMQEQHEQPSQSRVDARVVNANTRFGFKLYAEVLKRRAGQNVLLSPSSVAFALSMVYNGAEGETKLTMGRVLELGGLSLEEINRANAALRVSLENPDPRIELRIANSLWARAGFTFKPEFMRRNKDYYGTEMAELDFSDPTSSAKINAWVNSKTNGKIPQIIDRIKRDSILILINAVYFKGQWAHRFDTARTQEEPFTLADGTQKRHPIMHQSGSYRYFEDPHFQAISLPYGQGRLSMYIFLPAKATSLEEFHDRLNQADWDVWMSRFTQIEGEIGLPRFTVEYEAELTEALKALGMGSAFDDRANLEAMIQASARASISTVRHKTFAAVNEEGTEAAAVTSEEVTSTSAMQPQRSFRMIVDHPFFFAIRDDHTGTLLFMGSITDPK